MKIKSTCEYYYNKYPELEEFFDEAFEKLKIWSEDECIDGYRIMEIPSSNEIEIIYDSEYTCCGSIDEEFKILDKVFKIGINYGH